jgi:hypothetical protein
MRAELMPDTFHRNPERRVLMLEKGRGNVEKLMVD